jgi:hypothetical protein
LLFLRRLFEYEQRRRHERRHFIYCGQRRDVVYRRQRWDGLRWYVEWWQWHERERECWIRERRFVERRHREWW